MAARVPGGSPVMSLDVGGFRAGVKRDRVGPFIRPIRDARRVLLLVLGLLACTEDGDCVGSNPLMPVCVPEEASRIVFVSNLDRPGRDDLLDLYTMNARGADVRRLTTHGRAWSVRWSPDGRELAFSEKSENFATSGNMNMVVMAADGSGARIISVKPAGADDAPAWSPDGQRIVFHSNRHDLHATRRSIYVMNSDGTNVGRLTTDNDQAPHWSPDGTMIAFMSSRVGGVMQIFVMNADGSDQRQLTTAGVNRWPQWSPDGTRIAFSSVRSTNGTPDNGIYVMNPDGSGQVNLTNAANMFDTASTWSNDGSEIYFQGSRGGWHINKITLATGIIRRLTDFGPMSMETAPNATGPLVRTAAAR
jgi:Tol biopolymer transport system component